MKIQIKDLKPNPFRDIENYPINEEKVKSLTNSINQTGFWDNILARPKPEYTFMTEQIIDSNEEYDKPCYMHIIYDENGKEKDYDDPIFEIAYGHHRLIVLQAVYKPDDYVDIPVKELDDPTMIRIMANENDESWGTTPKIIDETVRVTKKFLEERSEILKRLMPTGSSNLKTAGATAISRFLGGNWLERRIYHSLERLGLIEKGELDKGAVESLPTERAARDFVKATKQIKTTPEQQREAAKNIIRNQSFGESSVKSVLLDEKYRKKKAEKDQREKNEIHFKNYMVDTTKIIKSLNDRFLALFELQSKYNFTFEIYDNSDEADRFKGEMLILIDYLKKFSRKGGKNSEADKLLQISD